MESTTLPYPMQFLRSHFTATCAENVFLLLGETTCMVTWARAINSSGHPHKGEGDVTQDHAQHHTHSSIHPIINYIKLGVEMLGYNSKFFLTS